MLCPIVTSVGLTTSNVTKSLLFPVPRLSLVCRSKFVRKFYKLLVGKKCPEQLLGPLGHELVILFVPTVQLLEQPPKETSLKSEVLFWVEYSNY